MATMACRGTAYSYYEYSYTTSEDANNVYFKLTLSFIAKIYDAVQTQLGPGWLTWVAPNWSFMANAYDTIATKGGSKMKEKVSKAGGVYGYWETPESYTHWPAGTLYTHNLTLTLPKGTEDKTVNVYFGVAVQSTYYWDTFAPSADISIGVKVPSKYKAVSGLKMSSSEIGTNSFKISASWTNGVQSDGRVYVKTNKTGNTEKLIDDSPVVFDYNNDRISSNTYYTVTGRLCDATHSTSSFETASLNLWTYPIINDPSLSLKSGSEHNTINVSVSPSIASEYDQFSYKLGNGSWTSWTNSKTHSFSSLSENTTYTVYVKMKNTSSGYESSVKSKSIVTWYNPISNLSVVLVNRWFWYLAIKASYSYNGTISKFEFKIGDDQGLQNKGTTNAYSRGSTTPGANGNLSYDTNYNCQAKLTDNHGRTAQANIQFKTLDERPLYVGNELREVKLIQPDGTVKYITPNLLSVVQPNGTVVNMNKIINNDSRTEYK